jgi:hypothetical protein
MKSLRQIEREYDRMLKKHVRIIGTKGTNNVNVYTCDNGHVIKTINRDRGTIPFLLNCGVCSKEARSSFFKDDRPDIEVSHDMHEEAQEGSFDA